MEAEELEVFPHLGGLLDVLYLVVGLRGHLALEMMIDLLDNFG